MALYTPDGLDKKREFVKSLSFLNCSNDINIIAKRLLKNQELCKLLYYTDDDCLSPDRRIVSDAEKAKMLHKNIKVIPYLPKDTDMLNYIVIQFDNFTSDPIKQEYISNYVVIDVICHIDNWLLDDGRLRPYLIMNHIDEFMRGSKLSGLGATEFVTAQQLLVSPSLAGFSMVYQAENLV